MANAILVQPIPFVARTASSTAAGFQLSNIANDYRGIIWRSGTADTVYWIIDLGSDVPVDTIMLCGVWGNFNVQNSRVRISTATSAQGPNFNGTATASGVGQGNYYQFTGSRILHEGEPIQVGNIAFLWERPTGDPSPTAIRYIHMAAFNMGAAGWIDISRMVVGRRIRLNRNFSFGAGFGVKDLGSIEWSRLGVMNRRRGAKLRTVSLTFNSIHKDEVEQAVQPLLEHVGVTDPIALVTDPAPHPMRQRRCYFGPLTGDTLATSWRRADAFSAPFNLVSLF